MTPVVRPREPRDDDAVRAILTDSWGATLVVSGGRGYDASRLPALVAESDGEITGLLTYDVDPGTREDAGSLRVVSLDAVVRRQGVATALLRAARHLALDSGCRRLWLTTTNELRDAIGFYLASGLRLVELHLDGVAADRAVKPSIPLVAADGTPVRDVWVFALDLADDTAVPGPESDPDTDPAPADARG